MRIMHPIEETRGIRRVDRKNIFNKKRGENEKGTERERERERERQREIELWKLQQRKWSEN